MQSDILIIFIRYPQAGLVKTRLARRIGADKAAHLYRLFVEALLLRTDDKNYQRIIFYTPADKKKEIIHWLGSGLTLQPQKGNNLGERLAHAFEFAFKHGARRVIAIGSDSPLLDKRTVRDAFVKLKRAPCVLGPASDGGYYLIGLSSFAGQIFKGIRWGTKNVLSQTIDRLKKSKISCRLLRASFDVDTHDDLLLLMKIMLAARKINLLGLSPIFDILKHCTPKQKSKATKRRIHAG